MNEKIVLSEKESAFVEKQASLMDDYKAIIQEKIIQRLDYVADEQGVVDNDYGQGFLEGLSMAIEEIKTI